MSDLFRSAWMTLFISSREQMNRVIQALRNKADIMDVYRVTG